jgi:PAS domain S-box-containing protein
MSDEDRSFSGFSDECDLETLHRIRKTVEESPEAIFWLEESGRISFANVRACESLGYARAELCRLHLWDIDPDFPPERWKQHWKALRTSGRRTFETRHRRQDGLIFPVEVCASQMVFGGEEIHLSFVRDITARVQEREVREKLETQLRHTQKMESVGQLAGGVAHDFNNMLSVILGYTEQILADQPQGTLLSDLQEIEKAAQRSADLTRQLLAFARCQTIAPRVFDLNPAVTNLLNMLGRLLGEDLELEWHPAPQPAVVRMDPSQLDQILANLCVNARDAIKGTGKVTIETSLATFNDAYCRDHLEASPGNFVMLAVSDDGTGMDRPTQTRIFEPYFTTKQVGEGTGLGLATVFGIVKQNEGRIEVYSEPEKGTTFKIYLPAHEVKQMDAELARQADKPPRGSETVLLVEDEAALLELGRRLLESLGYRVICASSPKMAMRCAQTTEPIDLMVTDVIMPEMNGRDLAGQLRVARPGLKVLFMSGYTSNVVAHHGVLDAGVCFLAKPFSVHDLAFKVREALDGPLTVD